MSEIEKYEVDELRDLIRGGNRYGLGTKIIEYIDNQTKHEKIDPLSPGFLAGLHITAWLFSMCTLQEQNKLVAAIQKLILEYNETKRLLGM